MATVELCAGCTLGSGFQLQVGLAEIHVPRMWVEEDDQGHHVSGHRSARGPGDRVCVCLCAGLYADLLPGV